jgi:hypothetical protein
VAIGAVWAFSSARPIPWLASARRSTILQAVIVLSIVVAYELVRRVRARQERRAVAQAVEGAAA